MPVFKSFIKVLTKHTGAILLYMIIFAAVIYLSNVSRQSSNSNEYTAAKANFAIFDYDNSPKSKSLTEYLKENATMVSISNDNMETIQDELYNRNVNSVIIVNKGFQLDVVTIPGTQSASIFKSLIKSFSNMYDTYEAGGYRPEEIDAAIKDTNEIKADVYLSNKDSSIYTSDSYYPFSYLGWVLLSLTVSTLAPVLIIFSKKELKERTSCSSYNYNKYNSELLLGVCTIGFAICVVFFVIVFVLMSKKPSFYDSFLHLLNLLSYMLLSLSISFLISRLAKKENMISMISNTISLGMAFLCGIFVPEEYLSDTIIKIAHFLPTYWFNQAVKGIVLHSSLSDILMCVGIELLFAFAIILVTIRIGGLSQVRSHSANNAAA